MILNNTKKSRDRYQVLPGHMGNYRLPNTHPNHHYEIVTGVDRGNGYQGYMAVDYCLRHATVPPEVKENLWQFLTQNGFEQWVEANKEQKLQWQYVPGLYWNKQFRIFREGKNWCLSDIRNGLSQCPSWLFRSARQAQQAAKLLVKKSCGAIGNHESKCTSLVF